MSDRSVSASSIRPSIITFNFETLEDIHQIRIVDQNGEPWFVAKDVCEVLGLNNVTMALLHLDSDEKSTLSKTDVDSKYGHLRIVNESGLYELAFRSRKLEAKVFRKSESWTRTVNLGLSLRMFAMLWTCRTQGRL